MLYYLLQTILFQLVFLLVFELMLKKETFFIYNRWYLLLAPVVSLLLPVFSFESLSHIVPEGTLLQLPAVILGETPNSSKEAEPFISSGISYTNSWLFIYLLGVLCSMFFFINKYLNLRQLFRNKVISNDAGLKIIELPNSSLACSFFRTIFLGDQLTTEERQQILAHEKVHVYQKHSLDLLFFEIFKILFWFNPLIYIYQVKIAALHEYLADEGVVKKVEKKAYYEQLLNTAFNTENISFINQFFNQSLIKKRIVMLQKTKSTSIAKAKFLILLPVMFCMLIFVSCSLDSGMEVKQESQESATTIKVSDVENQSQAEKAKVLATAQVPFSLIEEFPIFPGCEGLATNEERKQCIIDKITAHVNTNFNSGVVDEDKLSGSQDVFVQFSIEKSGEVLVIETKASDPTLEAEARRVVESLPKMIPGKHRGKAVDVIYSLPIRFMLPADNFSEGE